MWKYAIVGLAGVAVGAHFFRAKESSCCERVKYGAIAKIAGYTGPFAPLTSGLLEATGIGSLLPGLLDSAGLPKDA